ncbi:MAG: hypothetical protein K9M07_07230 [Simkaniaceae bacterium]|nr:hypothetical protein [Simkaniaceae bacterium]MCF7853013.1 hypothetical protein [Simkaniaceae bacterium]
MGVFPLYPEDKSLVEQQSISDQQYLALLNEEIERLEDERNKYIARAARFQDQGDRLQFQPEYLVEARRYWNKADEASEIANQLQVEIDRLKLERDQLLLKIQKEGKTKIQ